MWTLALIPQRACIPPFPKWETGEWEQVPFPYLCSLAVWVWDWFHPDTAVVSATCSGPHRQLAEVSEVQTHGHFRPERDRAALNCYWKQEVRPARSTVSDWKCGHGRMLARSLFVFIELVFLCCVYRVLTSSSCAAKGRSPCCSCRTSPVRPKLFCSCTPGSGLCCAPWLMC